MSLSLVLFTLLPVLAQAADLFTTRKGLSLGLIERNPLLAKIVVRPGLFIAFKSVVAVVFAVYTVISFKTSFALGVIFSLVTSVPTLAIAVNNVIQIQKKS